MVTRCHHAACQHHGLAASQCCVRAEKLDRQLRACQAQVRETEEKLAIANKKIQDLTAKKTSINSSKPPSSDMPSTLRPKKPKTGKSRGGQPGHVGAQRKLLPESQVTRAIELIPKSCTRCNESLKGRDSSPLRHQVIEIPPIAPDVTEYRRHALQCSCCGKVTRALLPAGAAVSSFGPRLCAMIAVCTAKYRMSKRSVKELLTDFLGVGLALGSVSRVEAQASAALAGAFEEAHQAIESAPVVNADETSWTQNKGKAWLWTVVTTFLAVFVIARGRGKEVAQRLLGSSFSGYLVSDRWAGYAFYDITRRQLCWAHLKRDFKLWEEYGGSAGRAGKLLIGLTKKMFKYWHRYREGDWTRSQLARQMTPVRRQVVHHLKIVASSNAQKPAGMAKHILKLEPALWSFLKAPGVEPTNNLAERTIRHAVLMRKSSFGTDSEKGSRYVERMLTTVASLRMQERNVLEFITESMVARREGRLGPSLLPQRSAENERIAA